MESASARSAGQLAEGQLAVVAEAPRPPREARVGHRALVARHVPLRSCAACGRRLPKNDLMRIVRTSSGRVQPDPTGKVSGRGTYLCAQEACWTQGLRKNRLDGALRATIIEQDRDALTAYYKMQVKLVGKGDSQ